MRFALFLLLASEYVFHFTVLCCSVKYEKSGPAGLCLIPVASHGQSSHKRLTRDGQHEGPV